MASLREAIEMPKTQSWLQGGRYFILGDFCRMPVPSLKGGGGILPPEEVNIQSRLSESQILQLPGRGLRGRLQHFGGFPDQGDIFPAGEVPDSE